MDSSRPLESNSRLASANAARVERYQAFDQVNAPYHRWQVEQFLGYVGQRVIEVGCGVGGIIAHLGTRELIFGVDIDQACLAAAEDRFGFRPECRFAEMDVFSCSGPALFDLQAMRFDTVVCINVLEHIRDDVAALQRMAQLLPGGGTLALLVPAHRSLYGPYDRLDGHFRRYSKAYLRAIIQHTDFRAVRMYYLNAIGALGWWFQYRLLRRAIHGQRDFRIMNRLLPLVRTMERLCPPPFGLSLVAILERPAPARRRDC